MKFTELKQLYKLIKAEVSSCLIVSDGFKLHIVKVKLAQKDSYYFCGACGHTATNFSKNYVGLKFKRFNMINRIT